MKKKAKMLLTTFIYGEKYQSYIPFLLYSCYKAYPQYDVILFVHGELNDNIKKLIYHLELKNNVRIRENCFDDCIKMTPAKSQSLRWVLWDDCFLEYHYLYTVDIDMFYIREPMLLHEQHIQHMDFIGVPISNLRRIAEHKRGNISQIKNRIKNAGIKSLYSFFTTNNTQFRLSGLHFVKIKEYYTLLTEEIRTKYTEEIYNNNIYKYVIGSGSDEILLHEIVEKIGIDTLKISLQTNSTNMLDFEKPNRSEFRPHHGIHMGVFRSENSVLHSEKILNSNPYRYYVDLFRKEIANDKKFLMILADAPDNIKYSFRLFFKYYKISLADS